MPRSIPILSISSGHLTLKTLLCSGVGGGFASFFDINNMIIRPDTKMGLIFKWKLLSSLVHWVCEYV